MGSGPPICARCGALSTPDAPACELCGARGAIAGPEPRPSRFFVGVRASFTCRACGFLAPLDRIDASGAAHCVRCGVEQAFDARQWRGALAFAHAVGDLAGPSPEGLHPHPRLAIDSPYADLGHTRSIVTMDTPDLGAPGALVLRAFPGHPPCPKCARPALAAPTGAGALRVTCACGLDEQHHIGAEARPSALIGVVAAGHRAGPEAMAAIESGAAFQCPTCGAPLPVDGRSRLATCGFCHVVSRLPDAAFRKVATVEPDTIWLLFGGPSLARRDLEQRAGEQAISAPPEAAPSGPQRALATLWRYGAPTAALAVGLALVGAAYALL